MKNSFLRPLAFEYVDAFEKKCQVEEVPPKFRPQPDDYQKRVRRDPDDSIIHEAASINDNIDEPYIQLPNEPTKKTLYTIQEMTAQMVSKPQIENDQPEPRQKGGNSSGNGKGAFSMFSCCAELPAQTELCDKCEESLCGGCSVNRHGLQRCTRCLQKICKRCKERLGLQFGEYKLRNYPIVLKKLDDLHFQGCTCPDCK